MNIKLSFLDLVPYTKDDDGVSVLAAAANLAKVAERSGYERLWYAEHHNTAGVASSATSVLIAGAGAVTERIKLGSGGIMLPNHSVLSVAEQFGTLANMFPGRIELGLGRAPGTDPVTAQLLRRGSNEDALSTFEDNIAALSWYFGDQANPAEVPQLHGVKARIAQDTRVPLWVLGSSLGGATVAARMGLPFSFASHFAPFQILEAAHVYRSQFNPDAPTAQIDQPKLMIGVNVSVAPTHEEAEELFSSHQQVFLNIRRGRSGPVPAPIKNFEAHLSSPELQMLGSALQFSAVGTPDEVVSQIQRLAGSVAADEVIVTSYSHDHALRARGVELLGEAWRKAAQDGAATVTASR